MLFYPRCATAQSLVRSRCLHPHRRWQLKAFVPGARGSPCPRQAEGLHEAAAPIMRSALAAESEAAIAPPHNRRGQTLHAVTGLPGGVGQAWVDGRRASAWWAQSRSGQIRGWPLRGSNRRPSMKLRPYCEVFEGSAQMAAGQPCGNGASLKPALCRSFRDVLQNFLCVRSERQTGAQ